VGEKAQMIARLRRRTDFRGMSIVGYVDIGNGQKVVNRSKFVQLGGMSLHQYVDAHEIDEIIVALDERRNTVPINEILECKMKGVHVIDVQTFYERQLGKILLDSLHPSNLVFADGFTQAVLKPTSKRLFDILVSGALLILSLPIMVFVSVAIHIESGGRGSIIYRQERVGKDGRVFEILKFRSMREDAEKDGIARWAKSNDTRVTKVGAFIRKTRLDELPQLINVLKGDMSIIGPRPERPQFVKELLADIPYYALRHYVKPGLTGWAQICYPYGASIKDAKEKLQYDLYYMKNYSLFLDLTILLETVQVIIWGKGAR
jgi:sugar transferase (PEP-CTERM system associated)